MGKVFISPTHAWVIPESGEKPVKIVFDPPEWQVEEQDDEKGILFSRKLTEEELAELKSELGMKPDEDKIGAIDANSVELDALRFLKEE